MPKELLGYDFLGQEFEKGDTVVFKPTRSNRELHFGTVLKVTPKGATVSWQDKRRHGTFEMTCNMPNRGLLKLGGEAFDQAALTRLGFKPPSDNKKKEDA